MDSRNINIDFLRCLACVFVVAIHGTYTYDPYGWMDFNNYTGLAIQSIVRAGLPIFFMISGYFCLNMKINSIIEFYKKRLISIILPFFVYSTIHLIIMNRNSIKEIDLYNDLIMKILNGSLSIHFWFVYVIIGIYLLSPIMNKIFTSMPLKIKLITGFVVFILSVFDIYIKIINPSFVNVSSFSIPSINMWYAYFIIGGVIGSIDIKINLKLAIFLVFIGYILTVIATIYNKDGVYTMPFDGGANMFLLCTSIFLIFTKTRIKLTSISSKVKYISQHTYGVYLIHISIFNIIYTYILTKNVLFNSIAMTSVGVVFSLLLVVAVDKIIINPIINILK